jgi:hypothetical protein
MKNVIMKMAELEKLFPELTPADRVLLYLASAVDALANPGTVESYTVDTLELFPLSGDGKKSKILQLFRSGLQPGQIARELNVSRTYISKVTKGTRCN